MRNRILHTYDAQCDKCKGVCKLDVSKPQPTANVSEHTPTPWRVILAPTQIVTDDQIIANIVDVSNVPNSPEKYANAAYIVLAVNSHSLLLTALKCLVSGNEPYSGCNIERAQQAIAKAEGGK